MSKAVTVAVAGGTLIGVNAWTSPQRKALADALNGKAGSTPASHKALVQIGGEALLVIVAAAAAGSSDAVGTGMVAAIVALWILWAIGHFSGNQPKLSLFTSSTPPPPATQAAA